DPHLAVLQQHAVPQRVVEVPDDALRHLLVFRRLRHVLLNPLPRVPAAASGLRPQAAASAGTACSSSNCCVYSWWPMLAMVICWICVLPSIISISFASRK